MRAPILVLLTALCTVCTVASAVEPSPPPSTPISPDLPASVTSELPDMGSPAGAVLSKSDEYRYGAMVARELHNQNGLIDDPEVVEYLNSVGGRLAAQSADGAKDFQFFLVKDPTINAFAVTGPFLFVNYGLILATENESQLAAVMAHELAHSLQHHIARELRAQSQQSMATAAAMLAAILLGAVGGGQAIEGGIMAAQGLSVQQQINFSRTIEAEADRVGIGYMAGAGFDPEQMATMFEILSRKEGLAATYYPAMLNNHPVTTDRIAEARSRAAQFPARRVQDSLTYQLIKERVRVITAPGDVDIEKQYAQKVAKGINDVGTRYGHALALMADNRPAEAEKILYKLVQEHQNVTLLYSALAQAEAKAGQVNDSLGTFKHAEALFPRNVPLTIRYAETLMAANNAKEAHAVLLDLFNNVPPTPEQIRLTALAASAAGDAGDAYFYMGEYQIAGGDLMLAAQQYQLALASPNLTTVQRQRFQARLDEVREYLASAHLRRTSNTGQDPSGNGGG